MSAIFNPCHVGSEKRLTVNPMKRQLSKYVFHISSHYIDHIWIPLIKLPQLPNYSKKSISGQDRRLSKAEHGGDGGLPNIINSFNAKSTMLDKFMSSLSFIIFCPSYILVFNTKWTDLD